MKARRLDSVRDDLGRDHGHAVKIADIANKWGFRHLGQFARDHRSWFGELPSDTYERKHGKMPGTRPWRCGLSSVLDAAPMNVSSRFAGI
jgi:AraC-like DNA-binding protein